MSNVDVNQRLTLVRQKLELDFTHDKFSPQDEYDIQGYLYHCMLETDEEETFTPTNKILPTMEWADVDLAVIHEGPQDLRFWAKDLTFKKRKKVNPPAALLLVQLKETHLASLT
jgi:hypothetical protein